MFYRYKLSGFLLPTVKCFTIHISVQCMQFIWIFTFVSVNHFAPSYDISFTVEWHFFYIGSITTPRKWELDCCCQFKPAASHNLIYSDLKNRRINLFGTFTCTFVQFHLHTSLQVCSLISLCFNGCSQISNNSSSEQTENDSPVSIYFHKFWTNEITAPKNDDLFCLFSFRSHLLSLTTKRKIPAFEIYHLKFLLPSKFTMNCT